ncbi:max-interacting protein 1-like [Tropilaelaps mercedesae]|uniref:Max-interacting protein 1-like n=1 Tax=Tropilaelaps mercedesae TaxID=418985 RepID=A0A1V9XHC2_9ACAR|nr:max-interacting protein 1-like [Tropilaelaps mercedesae]
MVGKAQGERRGGNRRPPHTAGAGRPNNWPKSGERTNESCGSGKEEYDLNRWRRRGLLAAVVKWEDKGSFDLIIGFDLVDMMLSKPTIRFRQSTAYSAMYVHSLEEKERRHRIHRDQLLRKKRYLERLRDQMGFGSLVTLSQNHSTHNGHPSTSVGSASPRSPRSPASPFAPQLLTPPHSSCGNESPPPSSTTTTASAGSCVKRRSVSECSTQSSQSTGSAAESGPSLSGNDGCIEEKGNAKMSYRFMHCLRMPMSLCQQIRRPGPPPGRHPAGQGALRPLLLLLKALSPSAGWRVGALSKSHVVNSQPRAAVVAMPPPPHAAPLYTEGGPLGAKPLLSPQLPWRPPSPLVGLQQQIPHLLCLSVHT